MPDVSQKPSVCGQKAVLDILCQANKNSDNLLLSPKNISDIKQIRYAKEFATLTQL